MTIEIAEDWFDNNISGQEGFTLDSENEVYTKTISEADLTFEFSTETDGEYSKEISKETKKTFFNPDFQTLFSVTRCLLHPADSPSMIIHQLGKFLSSYFRYFCNIFVNH